MIVFAIKENFLLLLDNYFSKFREKGGQYQLKPQMNQEFY
ncbi:hypothetical protein I600_692 [Maribacter dokdonensis DSW-8]|nr:hypothetical protein I600_692 [Maribacter dokdonensis DSW-8]